MSKKLLLLTSILLTFSVSSIASSSSYCAQQDSSFLSLVREYQSCNSVVGSDSSACQSFCSSADLLLGRSMNPVGAGCSSDQLKAAESNGRQQGRNDIIRDLSAKEDYVSADFYGINEADCGQRVAQATQKLRLEAINKCNSKAQTIKNCFIRDQKVIGQFARPPKFEGASKFEKDDNKSTEEECKKTALANAQKAALNACSTATGAQCTVLEGETILTHREEKPWGPRLGRRDQRICQAKIFVEAPKDLTYKCNMRISARNQYSAE